MKENTVASINLAVVGAKNCGKSGKISRPIAIFIYIQCLSIFLWFYLAVIDDRLTLVQVSWVERIKCDTDEVLVGLKFMHRYGILWCTLLFSGILLALLSRIFIWNYFYDYFDYGTSLFFSIDCPLFDATLHWRIRLGKRY